MMLPPAVGRVRSARSVQTLFRPQRAYLHVNTNNGLGGRVFQSRVLGASRLSVPIPTGRHAFRPLLNALITRRAFSSTTPKFDAPSPKSRIPGFRTVVKWSAILAGSTVVGIFVLTGAIFLHDAFTYTEKVRNFALLTASSADLSCFSTSKVFRLHPWLCTLNSAVQRTYLSRSTICLT